MRLPFVILILGQLLHGNAVTSVTEHPSDEKLYQMGVQLLEQGEVEKALNIWMGARNKLEKPDVRIGFRFIETVSARELEKYYRMADIMYHWALREEITSHNRSYFEMELERLAPILERGVQKKWKAYLEKNSELLGRSISEYWKNLDPTPLTNYNERLIEHWMRLAYIKEHFTRDAGNFAEADARAEVYLKYGAPDVNRSGVLAFKTAEIINLINQVRGVSPGVERKIETSARSLHSDYHYKIWIYHDIKTLSNEELVFLFGNRTGEEAPYRKFEGAADFVPAQAYSRARDYRSSGLSSGTAQFPFTVGTLMHIMYLNQLSAKANIFASRYADLASEYDKALTVIQGVSFGTSKLVVSGGRNESKKEQFEFKKRESAAPPEKSRDADLIPKIESGLMQRRFLDKDGQTYMYLFAKSSLDSTIVIDLIHNNKKDAESNAFQYNLNDTAGENKKDGKQPEYNTDNYTIKHGITVKNNNEEVAMREVVEAMAYNARTDSLKIFATSVFKLNYKPEKTSQVTFSAELHNNNPNTEPLVKTAFPSSLRGMENKKLPLIEPLNADRPELSDLLLGYNYLEDRDSELKFPFTLSYDNTIPRGESLVFYVEAYNLPGENGIYEGDLTYKIVSQKDNVIQKVFGKWNNEQTSITMKLKSDKPSYKNAVEVETASYKPGDYKLILSLELQDKAEEQVTREVEFTIE